MVSPHLYLCFLHRIHTRYNGRIRGNMFLFEEKRAASSEARKSVIRMDNVQVSVVKTKEGAIFKERNYIELYSENTKLLGMFGGKCEYETISHFRKYECAMPLLPVPKANGRMVLCVVCIGSIGTCIKCCNIL